MNAPLDLDTLAMLEELLGDDLSDVLATFTQDAPQRMAAIETALAAGDVPGMERAAHTLKGAASNLGAQPLTEACNALVQACRKGTAEAAPTQVAAIRTELERVLRALAERG